MPHDLSNLTSKEAKMGKVMRHTLGASLNIRHNLSSSKGPKPLQLKLLTTYIPKTSAFTLAFSTSQRLRTTRASARTFFTFRSEERFSRNAETDLVCRLLLEKKKIHIHAFHQLVDEFDFINMTRRPLIALGLPLVRHMVSS